MKSVYMAVGICVMLAACGKKVDVEAAQSVAVKLPDQCWSVTIIHMAKDSDGNVDTLLETDPERIRFHRGEYYGNIGEKFTFCNPKK